MGKSKNRSEHIKDAAEAHSDLNTLYAIIALCEGGLFSSQSYAVETRIREACLKASGRCLDRYDRAVAAAESSRT